MLEDSLARLAVLPELKFIGLNYRYKVQAVIHCKKVSTYEVCPKCAQPSRSVHDRRWVEIKDSPIRGRSVTLRILKRRFRCRLCLGVFTEPVPGIGKGQRTTERFRKTLFWLCERFENLSKVREHLRCSSSTIHRHYYNQAHLKLKTRSYSWPRHIGIDEHKWAKNKHKRYPEFATIFVDHVNKRIYDLARDRDVVGLKDQIKTNKGKDNVRYATIDLSPGYRRFIKESFPNAKIIADKFHVVRLLHPHINRHRKQIAGDRRRNPIGKLLLRNSKNLKHHQRRAVNMWLAEHKELTKIYLAKEAIHRLYRTKGYNRAQSALLKLCDWLGRSEVKELLTLRKTLLSWRYEILEYFNKRLTNGRTEAFNAKAKLIRKKGYGYRSFKNYRVRLLTC